MAVVGTATMCCSFIGLETLDNKLTHSTVASVADDEYGHLKDAVLRSRPEVLRAMEQVAAQLGVVLKEAGSDDLLAIERRLIEDARAINNPDGSNRPGAVDDAIHFFGRTKNARESQSREQGGNHVFKSIHAAESAYQRPPAGRSDR
ncbi:MAG TPA: hypothetical protein VF453_22205 [Burkholderiaceae bacterium]